MSVDNVGGLLLSANIPLSELVASIRQFSSSGSIRHLRLKSPDEFSQFAHAFGWPAHEDIGNPVRRTIHAPNVATANEGPNTQPVYPHNEFGLSPHYPQYVFFFCMSAPETGGETPINHSVILHERLKERVPGFIEVLEKKGVKYQLFYPNRPRDDVSSSGTSILQSYGIRVLDTDTVDEAREKVEAEIRRLPTAFWVWENQSETNPLGDLRVWQTLPALRRHEQSGQIAFFNNAVSRYLNAKGRGTLRAPHVDSKGMYFPPCFYSDGELIPDQFLETAVEIIDEIKAKVAWQTGDVLLLDNHQVQHAREPWTGSRKLLASLWD
ncbi:Clavaminate synthase-like protein [Mytilinidion resinicola]|uniref:Clavaminate synthase-like protein n=1 Tax=Mytilinidion resinicola TaxID=574789 RepID=A0A6A6YEV4_9PEZI|nr:Clavaminate synthase-like protein [Mytilinidion resinicola]KAF2806585.1 Clavaminate synthase-like protein [Mytilinidion resinicola]